MLANILITEDEAIVRKDIERCLTSLGYNVVATADSGKEAIEKAQKFIESQKCGASLYFLGTVRDHNNDKTVTGITYDAHDAMVKKSFKDIPFGVKLYSENQFMNLII